MVGNTFQLLLSLSAYELTIAMLRVPGAQGFAFLAKDLPGFRLSGSQVCFFLGEC